jgi:hypothetical protein
MVDCRRDAAIVWPLDRVIANIYREARIEKLVRDHGATFFPLFTIARFPLFIDRSRATGTLSRARR